MLSYVGASSSFHAPLLFYSPAGAGYDIFTVVIYPFIGTPAGFCLSLHAVTLYFYPATISIGIANPPRLRFLPAYVFTLAPPSARRHAIF